MSEPKRIPAFLAYLLSVIGWLYVLLFRREDEFAVYHARQSSTMTLVVVVAPVIWAIVGWLLSWIPLVGPIIAVALFSLIIALYAFMAVLWAMGMVHALQAKMEPLPLVGEWTQRLWSR